MVMMTIVMMLMALMTENKREEKIFTKQRVSHVGKWKNFLCEDNKTTGVHKNHAIPRV